LEATFQGKLTPQEHQNRSTQCLHFYIAEKDKTKNKKPYIISCQRLQLIISLKRATEKELSAYQGLGCHQLHHPK